MWAQLDEECVIKANSQLWEQMLAMTLDPVPLSGEFRRSQPPATDALVVVFRHAAGDVLVRV